MFKLWTLLPDSYLETSKPQKGQEAMVLCVHLPLPFPLLLPTPHCHDESSCGLASVATTGNLQPMTNVIPHLVPLLLRSWNLLTARLENFPNSYKNTSPDNINVGLLGSNTMWTCRKEPHCDIRTGTVNIIHALKTTINFIVEIVLVRT